MRCVRLKVDAGVAKELYNGRKEATGRARGIQGNVILI